MVKSNVPIRICGSKTRTGCRICKQRHVKCDEQRPVCLRCQKGNRRCVYEPVQPQTRSVSEEVQTKLTNPVLAQQHRSTDSPSTIRSISPCGPRKLSELTAVKNFTTHLGKELAGYFSDDVWCQVFPRVAQHEPSVWHAIVAISMLDTSIQFGCNRDVSNPDIVEAITQYSKAIQKLNVQLASGENAYYKDVVLLCCILFAIFECLQNHFRSALRHISGGMKLLMEWEKEVLPEKQGSSGAYLDKQTLRPIFLCLDSQSVQMGAVDFEDFNYLPAIKAEHQLLTSFDTVQEAHVHLNAIFNRMSRWTGQIEPGTKPSDKPDDDWLNVERRRLQNELTEWDWAFETSQGHFNSQTATLLLTIQSIIMQTIFDKEVDGPSEMEWDKYLPRFEEAVMHAETFMALDTASCSDSPRYTLTITMDIVLSLFLISTRCRWSHVRRRALKMMKGCRRREGIWDSSLCSEIAETIIELEEEGASEDGLIPENARVWQLECSYGENETPRIRHKKLLPNGDGSYRIETFE